MDMDEDRQLKLSPYMTPAGTWAFSIGTSIGWGSFVVTCSTYLASAGIMGTVLGLILGTVVILVITRNLQFMISQNPEAGGIYSYCRKICGHDYGFITAWFLFLTYAAILWANITSLPLFARYFLGDTFRTGFLYKVFGYDVYLGNTLLSIAAVIVVGFLCSKSVRIPQTIMIICATVFTGAILLVLALCLFMHPSSGFSYEPLYLPEKGHLNQIVRIAIISPWAFIGFENVAHFSEELTYPVKKVRKILIISVIVTATVYTLVTLLSVTAYPDRYDSWLSYIRDLDNLSGIEGVPAFYAAYHYIGNLGVSILLVALFGIILTSIIGNLTALSRLLFALSRDGMIAGRLSQLNEKCIPSAAVWAAVAPACVIPFLGRTAIGWIVDVTTLGATMIYGFLSYAVYKDAKKKTVRTEKITGVLGLLIMIVFVIMLMIPELIDFNAMATETYFLFTAWSILGILFFRWTMKHDSDRNFGRSIVVWIVLLVFVLFTSLVWVSEHIRNTSSEVMSNIESYYSTNGVTDAATAFLATQRDHIIHANSLTSATIFVLFVFSVWIMLANFIHMRKWEQEDSVRIGAAEMRANTDPLTGVKSKAAYVQLERQVDEQIDKDSAEYFSVVVCDINDLKLVNDTKGHKAGDEIIKTACTEICKVFSHSPVFRIGGDEFVVYLQGQDYENRRCLFEDITRASDERAGTGGIVISTGIADYVRGQDTSLRSVFEEADMRMYERKKELKERTGGGVR